MKPITRFVMAAFAVTTLIPATAMAGAQDSKNQGYLIDSLGDSTIVRSGTSLCWHDSDWTPERSVEPACDPNFKPVAEVITPTPRPATVAAAPAVTQPEPQKVSFSADTLFAFDKSVLKPEGKAALDSFVHQLDGTNYDRILATGHTDRFGSNQYNQKLSERRAQTVKDYLVSQNVQAGRIDMEGRGETLPVTKADDCLGAKSTKVVACLQPDRRVEIEMTGTKTVTGSL